MEPFELVAGDGADVQIARMLAARERAGRIAAPRRWTIEPPLGALVPKMSLDQELELRGWVAD